MDALSRVVEAPEKDRFELYYGEEHAGLADYQLSDGELAVLHTEIDQRFGGRGLGGQLTRVVLDTARQRGLSVLPYCSFTRDWIVRHPEYTDLVPASQRERFSV